MAVAFRNPVASSRALKATLCLGGLALAAPGVESLYRQLANGAPVVLTCREYAQQSRPRALRVRARECEVDYLGAGYRESDGDIEELFFPVRPAGTPRSQPVSIVAATRDPAVLAIAQSSIGGGRQPNQEEFLVMMLKIVAALGAAREISGVARVGALDRIRARRALSGLTTPLAAGVVVVDLHAEPSLLGPIFLTALGAALVLSSLLIGRKLHRTGAGRSPAGDAAVTLPEVRLRGLLLVNIGPDGGAERIEYAAPLGKRQETMRRIAGAIEGIAFDARGRGVVRGADYAVIVDINLEDPVSSAIAGADGVRGATALQRLLVETGWRAYVPIEGRFLEPADLLAPSAPGRRPDG